MDSDTPERLLRAAESLFMEQGFEATTLRQITAQAGVNLAAVNYHYGSKEALIAAVFERRMGWLNRHWLAELDRLEAEAAGKPLRAHQILTAFFGVALRLAADREFGGHDFMRLLGRTYSAPSPFVRQLLAREHAIAIPRFQAALQAALPEVPALEVRWRFHFMLGAMSYAIAGNDALNILGTLDDRDHLALEARLLNFLLAGLRAPLPELSTRAAPSDHSTRSAPSATHTGGRSAP